MIVCVRERMIIPPSQATNRLTTTIPFLAYLRVCVILALVVFIRRRR